MFRRDVELSPKERANKAVMKVIVRFGLCGFLIYYMAQMLSNINAETSGATAQIIVSIAMLVVSAVVIGLTVVELIRGIRAGYYSAAAYEEAEKAEGADDRPADDAGPSGPAGESDAEDQD